MENDTFRTITKATETVLFKEKKSKFFGYAFPIQNENEVKALVDGIKKNHPTANHVCYAWQLGVEKVTYRANDDGEPNNSAGMPIYGQIQSFNITNVLVAVARVFGGTKLGIGGLISAYRASAKTVLTSSRIVEKTLQEQLKLHFEYGQIDLVMRLIKQRQLTIISQKMELNCELIFSVRKKELETVIGLFKKLQSVRIEQFT